jgi:N-acetylmuramoyl-L-alanine amidase
MNLNIVASYMTKNDCYRQGKSLAPQGVMIHATASPGVMAADWFERWNKPGVAKCVHAFVDSRQAVQYLPWTMRGWHCGSGAKGSGNNTYIGLELCEDVGWSQDYFRELWQRAVELTADLCRLFHLTEKDVISHREGHALGIASNHQDPDHWWPKFGRTMDDFRRDVAQALAGEDPVSGGGQQSMGAKQVNTPGDTLNLRTQPDHRSGILGTLAHRSLVEVLELASNGWMRVKQGSLTGWVNGKYLADVKSKPDLNRLLKLTSPYMRGEDVRWTQEELNRLGHDSGAADGIYGPKTRDAVIAFQRARGLAADGIVGPITWAAL